MRINHKFIRLPIPMHLVLVDYANGVGVNKLAKKYGFSSRLLTYRLQDLSVKIRGARKWPKQETARNSAYKQRYGIDVEHYNLLLSNQGGVCAICKQECSTKRRLAIDHDHNTGFIRGLLCRACNVGLGFFRDSALLLQRASEYVAT